MAARYAQDTFTITAGGAAYTVILGSRWDSTHPAVTAAPALFSTTPPAVIHPRLAAYLMAYPDGHV